MPPRARVARALLALLALHAAPLRPSSAQRTAPGTAPRAASRPANVDGPPVMVRAASGAPRTVPVVDQRGGASYIRADLLASALRATLGVDRGRYRLRLADVSLELLEGVPFVRAGESEYALSAEPYVDGERLYVPVQLVADVLPRAVAGWTFDARQRELRAFSTTARRGTAPSRAVSRPEPRSTPRSAPQGDDAPASPAPAPLAAGVGEPAPAATRGRWSRPHVIVVDAGHGGPDGGMAGPIGGGPQIQEKDVTLGVARALRDALRERGLGVVMTRTTDTLISLADRGRIANQRKGDLFVSVHVNAANPGWRDPAATRGFETYFLAEAKTEDARRVEAMENESVRFETNARASKDDPLNFIINDMAQNEHLRESSRLAALVQRRLAAAHPGPSRGVRQAGFRVLVTAFMPAVLVEIGFGTNAQEAAWMTSARGQRAIAGAVADAAVEYLQQYERRVSGGAQ